MRCERHQRQIRAMARGEIIGSLKLREHARGCLRCQAEMSRERRIQRELQALRDELQLTLWIEDHLLFGSNDQKSLAYAL
jgi:hypothetical protein